MANVTTVNNLLLPMMGKPSVLTDDGRCAICGRYPDGAARVERHHIVRRGAGKAFDEAGRELRKPEIMVCGLGNNLYDANGRMLCHGAIHHGYIHLRWKAAKVNDKAWDFVPASCGKWQILRVKEPCSYQEALEKGGWKDLKVRRGQW